MRADEGAGALSDPRRVEWGSVMKASLIAYECVASEHRPTLSHPDKLTVHEGHWAFCAFDARANDHEWRATGGESIDRLMARAGLPATVGVHAREATAVPAARTTAR